MTFAALKYACEAMQELASIALLREGWQRHPAEGRPEELWWEHRDRRKRVWPPTAPRPARRRYSEQPGPSAALAAEADTPTPPYSRHSIWYAGPSAGTLRCRQWVML